ncbi:hypothetical protein NM688_g4356 [Phlebia brevispora]|uniref:Uncharacterized protein n=1 Tax=Phlebia brevispora TaxID=194682 RepID=A0ACC1T335_9APHY|nr:hypothetical protein NM688_g4356 [Phlebia brevispora]
MAAPVAKIRPFVKDEDNKVVLFALGKAHMEGLAAANRKGTLHHLKPSQLTLTRVGYNRPSFEERTQQVLHGLDLVDLENYYLHRSPASGLWILELGSKFVGVIAIDASLDSLSEETTISIAKAGKPKTKTNKSKEATSDVASIRHFYVQEEYRKVFIQDDLLEYALEQTFSHRAVKSVRATESAVTPWVGQALRKQGFEIDEVVGEARYAALANPFEGLVEEALGGAEEKEGPAMMIYTRFR